MNKNIILAYTPLDQNNIKAVLFYKITRVQTGNISNFRQTNDMIATNFMSGTGGWIVPPANALAEITAFIAQSRFQLENLDDNARRNIANKVVELRQNNNLPHAQRMLDLYNNVYIFTYHAPGAVAPIQINIHTAQIALLNPQNIGQVVGGNQAVLTVELRPGGGGTAHILCNFGVDPTNYNGVDHRLTPAAQGLVLNNYIPFSWNMDQLLNIIVPAPPPPPGGGVNYPAAPAAGGYNHNIPLKYMINYTPNKNSYYPFLLNL